MGGAAPKIVVIDPWAKAPEGYIPGLGRGAIPLSGGVSRDRDVQAKPSTEPAFDPIYGYADAAGAEYDEEDAEADRIYDEVESKMDQRRKGARETQMRSDLEVLRDKAVAYKEEFSELKANLKDVTRQEWENIPEVQGDASLRYKNQGKKTTFVAVRAPDSLLASAASNLNQNSMSHSIPLESGLETAAVGPSAAGGAAAAGLGNLAVARSAALSAAMIQAGGSTTATRKEVDREGYLTAVATSSGGSSSLGGPSVADVQQMRKLFKAMTKSAPQHSGGWLMLARVEVQAGKLADARKVLAKGCENCPLSEDLWLEALKIAKQEEARVLAALALKQLPLSVPLWIAAAELEVDKEEKLKVLQRALETAPGSIKLWEFAVSIEDDPAKARVLLEAAVVDVPSSTQMWLALAKVTADVQGPKEAQAVINRARKALPLSPDVWIAAARLVERTEIKGDVDMSAGGAAAVEAANDAGRKKVLLIIQKAISTLAAKEVLLDRARWLDFARRSETANCPAVADAIVRETLKFGIVDEESSKRQWKNEATAAFNDGYPSVARSLLRHAIAHMQTVGRSTRSVWRILADFDAKSHDLHALDETLRQAVLSCPTAVEFPLMRAKNLWKAQKNPEAAAALLQAQAASVASRLSDAVAALHDFTSRGVDDEDEEEELEDRVAMLRGSLDALVQATSKVYVSEDRLIDAENLLLEHMDGRAAKALGRESRHSANEIEGKGAKRAKVEGDDENDAEHVETGANLSSWKIWMRLIQIRRERSWRAARASSFCAPILAPQPAAQTLLSTLLKAVSVFPPAGLNVLPADDKCDETAMDLWKSAFALAQAACSMHVASSTWKLHLIRAQLMLECPTGPRLSDCADLLHDGVTNGKFKSCIPMWSLLARVRLAERGMPSASAIILKAQLANPGDANLWRLVCELEKFAAVSQLEAETGIRIDGMRFARGSALDTAANATRSYAHVLSSTTTAISECPNDGALAASKIWLEPVHSRKARCAEALQRLPTDPNLLLTAAFLMGEGEVGKQWFQRATEADPKNGDCRAANLSFMLHEIAGAPANSPACNSLLESFSEALAQLERDVDDLTRGATWLQINKSLHGWRLAPGQKALLYFLLTRFNSAQEAADTYLGNIRAKLGDALAQRLEAGVKPLWGSAATAAAEAL